MCSPTPPDARRTPIVTATSATERVATSSSTADDANATRSVRSVARRYRSVISAIRSDWALARRCATRVGKPRTTSRKWPESAAISRHCSWARSRVASPTRAPKRGTRGRVASTITALRTSWVAMATTVSGGSTTATTRDGRYRVRYGSMAATPRVVSTARSPPRSTSWLAIVASTSRRRRTVLTTSAARAAPTSPAPVTMPRAASRAAVARPHPTRSSPRSAATTSPATAHAWAITRMPLVAPIAATPTS